ncbi:MAG: VOC family protein [Planctomycetota bacterium]
MFHTATPVLNVSSIAGAERFYCKQLGFERRFAYRPDESLLDPCYMGLKRDEAQIHVSSFSGDAVVGGVVNLIVDNLDGLHESLVAAGISIELPPTDQTWGDREMYVLDPDGNCLRFEQK